MSTMRPLSETGKDEVNDDDDDNALVSCPGRTMG